MPDPEDLVERERGETDETDEPSEPSRYTEVRALASFSTSPFAVTSTPPSAVIDTPWPTRALATVLALVIAAEMPKEAS